MSEAITSWHAHIYYDPDRTRPAAAALREEIGARFPERHSDTAGVDDANPADRAVELHVGMPADDQGDVEPSEDRQEARGGHGEAGAFIPLGSLALGWAAR